MCLSTSHCLGEQKGACLITDTLKTIEGFLKKGLHSGGNEILFKKSLRVYLALQQIRQIQNHITSFLIENAFSRCACFL